MNRLERLVDTEIPVPVWIFPPTVRNWLEKLWAWEKYPKFRRSLITGSVLTVSSLVVWIFIRFSIILIKENESGMGRLTIGIFFNPSSVTRN